jgi:hypothetical protein
MENLNSKRHPYYLSSTVPKFKPWTEPQNSLRLKKAKLVAQQFFKNPRSDTLTVVAFEKFSRFLAVLQLLKYKKTQHKGSDRNQISL